MPKTAKLRQEQFHAGEFTAVEPQRIPLEGFKILRNFDIAYDGLPEAAPGYTTLFSITRSRQIAEMEHTEIFPFGNLWTGAAVKDASVKEQGFESLRHAHGGAGTLTSTFSRNLSFIGTDFADADILHFWFNISAVADVTSVEVRFRTTAGDYFSLVRLNAALVTGAQTFDVARSAIPVGAGAPSWSNIVDLQVITVATGAVDISFDNFKITSADPAIQDPITGLKTFDDSAVLKKFRMPASGDGIYSHDGVTLERRIGKLALGQMVHMLQANNMLIALNGLDVPQRLDLDDTIVAPHTAPTIRPFMPLGVPIPPNTLVMTQGAAGVIAAGTYHAVVVFDMGVHGEGNPQSTPSSVTIAVNRQINYSSIPAGPPGTIRRLIYRTIANAGANATKYLDVIVNDNTSTTATSNNTNAAIQAGTVLVEDANVPPVANYGAFANNTLYLAGIPGRLNSIVFSDRTRAANRTIEQFRTLNEFKLDVDDGDFITGLFADKRYVHIFKRFSHYILDPLSNATPTRLSTVFGAVNQRSITSDGQKLYFMSSRFGPLAWTGAGYERVGLNVRPKDDRNPGFDDINGERISSSLSGIFISTQSEFKRGVAAFNDTTADDVPGQVQLERGGSKAADENISLRNSTVATETDVVGAASISFPDLSRDNREDTGAIVHLPLVSSVAIRHAFPETHKVAALEIVLQVKLGFPGTLFMLVETLNPTTGLFESFGFGSIIPTGLNTYSFTAPSGVPTETAVVRVSFFRLSSIESVDIELAELRIFEQGFEQAGDYTTDIYDLGSAPADWGRFLAIDSVVPANQSITYQMRSGATSAACAAAAFSDIISGQTPDPSVFVPSSSQFVQFRASFTGDGKATPILYELSLSFITAGAATRPIFETASAYYEDRWWVSPVRRGSQKPTGLWKMERHVAFSEHDDYQMSVFDVHQDQLSSGSSIDGKVFINAKDLTGARIGDKDGRQINCLLETSDTPLGLQDLEKTLLDFQVAARNEAGPRVSILQNGGFESWAGGIPDSWVPSGVINTLNTVTQDTDIRNVLNGDSAAKIDRVPGTLPTGVELRQRMRLLNSTNYLLALNGKVLGAQPDVLSVVAAAAAGPATLYLQSDGTWNTGQANLAAGFTFTGFYQRFTLAFKTFGSIENFLFAELRIGYATSSPAGTLWLDDVDIFEVPSQVSRRFLITPILDGVDDLPAREMFLTGDPLGPIVDLAVRKERFRIDRAGVRNIRFRVEHREAEARAKLMGLYLTYSQERVRDGY